MSWFLLLCIIKNHRFDSAMGQIVCEIRVSYVSLIHFNGQISLARCTKRPSGFDSIVFREFLISVYVIVEFVEVKKSSYLLSFLFCENEKRQIFNQHLNDRIKKKNTRNLLVRKVSEKSLAA